MGIRIKQRVAKLLMNIMQSVARNEAGGQCIGGNTIASSRDVCAKPDRLDSRAMTLKIYPGLGGLAIETYTYEPRTGDSTTTLHIIPDGEELSDALSKIITIDTMRMR